MEQIIGQKQVVNDLSRILKIFLKSKCAIKPHFMLAGSSGSGKTFTIKTLAKTMNINFIEINAAQLTKEGTSGNSLSKALSPLANMQNKPTICFVDEFDKLFISGNTNSSLAHETTNGVQNEFLTVLESGKASVYGDYGKYIIINTDKVLFVFAGAFNGERDMSVERLLQLGVKTEFLGRCSLVYNTEPLELEEMYTILEGSKLLKDYLEVFNKTEEEVIPTLKSQLASVYEDNVLGARVINTLIHNYFIKGSSVQIIPKPVLPEPIRDLDSIKL